MGISDHYKHDHINHPNAGMVPQAPIKQAPELVRLTDHRYMSA